MKRNLNVVTRIVDSCLRVPLRSNSERFLYLHSISLLFAVFLALPEAGAQDSEKKTHFLIEPYFMAPTMKGEIGVRQLPASEVDADAGDIFGQLKFGAMAYVEVNYDYKWSVTTDFLFMDLESDVKPDAIVTGGTVEAKQLAFEFAGLKRIAPWFEVGVGGRVIDMKLDVDLSTVTGGRSGSSRKTWADPIIIVRSQGKIQDKWLLQFRGDIGGFGIASDLTWQIQANVGYQFSKLVNASIGYRVLDVNYDKGDGTERFMYDIATSGPVLRVGFSWE
ncbi:MAG TPA: hypothetical protein VK666_20180 [Chryseolinea sp.]|nr:hypothetical protein [Chryseolinea sp.]